jgi:uncharacterized protein (TIGR00375 family)
MIFADLHLHSRYSRACSKDLSIDNLSKYAKIKGLGLLGTGDFTHPEWLKELKTLEERDGLLWKDDFAFVLQAELSNMFPQGGKGRRVHNVVLAPSIEVVEQINDWLAPRGKLASDGRPIFGGMSCIELVEGLMSISKDIEVVPAHIWTPWFSVLGSKSGFDSIEECFGDTSKHIHALETGLSSDPAMNWMVSSLDKYQLISNSDSHSFWPHRIGRECNALDINLNYESLLKALRTGDGLEYTVEVDPAYGKYHFDGHRNCGVSFDPAKEKKEICPKCGKPLTIGVMNRVVELADRSEGEHTGKPFKTLLPLSEVIAFGLGVKSVSSKKVEKMYYDLVEKYGSEMEVLLNADLPKGKVEDLILKNREGSLEVRAGFDGEYGVIV